MPNISDIPREASVADGQAEARQGLRALFGYEDFRAGQEAVISRVLAGEDVLAIMPTGAGKSLCYQLPAMLLPISGMNGRTTATGAAVLSGA